MTFNFNTCLPGMLSACSYVYADKFTACVQNVHLPNACMHRNVSCVHVRCSVRQSWCPSELQNFVELGVKINDARYPDVLLTQKLLPVIRQISGNEFVFQQDSAPAHNAHETVELLCRETHWTLFHRNSGHRTVQILTRWIQNLAYNAAARLPDKGRNVDELWQCLLNVWSSIEQDVIDASIDQWRVQLKACVRSGGGHFEHMLQIYLHRHTNKQIIFLVDIYWN